MNKIPSDYKSHLEKIVADLYKKFDEEDNKRKSLKIADDNYIKTQKKLDELIKTLNKPKEAEPVQFIGNTQFLKLMGISIKTAQTWRDNGIVSFSQIGNKIYYKIADIQELLDKNYRKSTIK